MHLRDLNLDMLDANNLIRARTWIQDHSGDVRTWIVVAVSLLLCRFFFLARTTDPSRIKSIPDFVADSESPETKAVREGVLGAWELISYEIRLRGRINYTSHPLGSRASGLLMYTADGHMSVQIQRPGARVFRGFGPHWGFWWEKSTAMSHYMAYGGTFRVGRLAGDAQPVIEHGVRHSLYPNWIGTGQVRLCKLEDGDRLVLRPHAMPKILASHST